MKEGEERAESAPEEDDVIAIADWAGERSFVGVEAIKNAIEEGGGGGLRAFEVSVELEELGE